ncbi:response regulator transcription factor [Paenibacillus aestuarii]|uniref:Response regulator transcription factor n=1 Tax=Paenibacillus aestuarii TaxID=516965 RepID=A0ABW0K6R1_9BACL|nr:response regulator transcription factor [Paenibacillus aestuarii]
MRVLLIEDETIIGDMIAMYLTDEDHKVERVENGRQGLDIIRVFNPEIIITDCILPDIDGIDVCKEIRDFSTVPIIMISMNTDIMNRVNALLAGADDYLCKPFSLKELEARMAAQMRRANHTYEPIQPLSPGKVDDIISIDKALRTISVDGKDVEMTFSEFEIMYLFNNNPGRVFSREELITYLRGSDTQVSERSIDVFVTKLRNKIEKDPKNPQMIKTVWGIGYKFAKA